MHPFEALTCVRPFPSALGCLPLLLIERIDVHYLYIFCLIETQVRLWYFLCSIHKSLESRIEEEFSAAISAADKLLPLSELFATASVGKLTQAIRGMLFRRIFVLYFYVLCMLIRS